MNLPNLLSLSRLALAVVFVLVSQPLHQAAVIALAGISDMVDGWIARRFGQRSKAGEVLDPVTDKLFVLTVVVTLLLREQLTLVQVVLLLTRDIFNTAMFAWFTLRTRTADRPPARPLRFKSRFSGKVVTVLQIATLLSLFVWPAGFAWMLGLTFVAALISIIDYASAGLASLRANR